MKDVQATVFDMIAETANVDVGQVAPATTIRDMGVASLDAIEMLFRLEETFDIELADRDIDMKSATAGMLVQAVERALGRRAELAAAAPMA